MNIYAWALLAIFLIDFVLFPIRVGKKFEHKWGLIDLVPNILIIGLWLKAFSVI